MLSVILGVAAEFTLTVFMILVSWGWTIHYDKIENFEIVIPLAIAVGIAQMVKKYFFHFFKVDCWFEFIYR